MFVSMPQFHFCSTFLFIFLYNIIYQFHPYGLNVYLSFFIYIYIKDSLSLSSSSSLWRIYPANKIMAAESDKKNVWIGIKTTVCPGWICCLANQQTWLQQNLISIQSLPGEVLCLSCSFCVFKACQHWITDLQGRQSGCPSSCDPWVNHKARTVETLFCHCSCNCTFDRFLLLLLRCTLVS